MEAWKIGRIQPILAAMHGTEGAPKGLRKTSGTRPQTY